MYHIDTTSLVYYPRPGIVFRPDKPGSFRDNPIPYESYRIIIENPGVVERVNGILAGTTNGSKRTAVKNFLVSQRRQLVDYGQTVLTDEAPYYRINPFAGIWSVSRRSKELGAQEQDGESALKPRTQRAVEGTQGALAASAFVAAVKLCSSYERDSKAGVIKEELPRAAELLDQILLYEAINHGFDPHFDEGFRAGFKDEMGQLSSYGRRDVFRSVDRLAGFMEFDHSAEQWGPIAERFAALFPDHKLPVKDPANLV